MDQVPDSYMVSTLNAKSIDHVNMTVNNLEKSIDFYTGLFGFEIKKDQSEDKSKIIGNDTIKLCLYEDPDNTEKSGINHFGFHVENFDQILEKCKEQNVKVLYGGAVDWENSKSRSIYIVDPNGYTIELSELSGAGL